MIPVDATVLQRRDTTEAWQYVNPVLPDGQLGWERDVYGNPVGVKMGDGVTDWNDLPYWFTIASGPLPQIFPVAAGSNYFQEFSYSDYAILFGTKIKNVGVYILVKDVDPTDGTTTVFRISTSCTAQWVTSDNTITGDITNGWFYLEQDPANPGLTQRDQYIILYQL